MQAKKQLSNVFSHAKENYEQLRILQQVNISFKSEGEIKTNSVKIKEFTINQFKQMRY